jgi:hypothetical protein
MLLDTGLKKQLEIIVLTSIIFVKILVINFKIKIIYKITKTNNL